MSFYLYGAKHESAGAEIRHLERGLVSEIFLDRKYLEYARIAFKVSKNIVNNTIFYNAILDYDLWV